MTKAKTKSRPRGLEAEARAWAQTCTRTPSRICPICTHDGMRRFVRAVLEMRHAGKSAASVRAIHAELVSRFGYDRTWSSLLYHFRTHETALWTGGEA